MINIVIADDHELIREGIKKIIRSSRDLRIVGEAADIAGVVALIEAHDPDIAILDITMPGNEGLAGLAEVRRRFRHLPVLLLSMHPEERYAVAALKAGAAGYISKAMAAEELVAAIRKAVAGGTYISEQLGDLLAADMRGAQHGAAPELSRRELQIIALMGAGMQVKQIAAHLAISISSVNTYRVRIFRKMGVSTNAALIRYALEQGLVA